MVFSIRVSSITGGGIKFWGMLKPNNDEKLKVEDQGEIWRNTKMKANHLMKEDDRWQNNLK